MTDFKNNLEEVWRKEFQEYFKAIPWGPFYSPYNMNKSDISTMEEGYVVGRKKAQDEISDAKKLSYKYYGESEQLKIEKKQLEQELLQAKKENVLLKQDFRSKLSYLSANKWTDKTSISIEMERLEKEQLRDRLKHEANMIERTAKNEISELEQELKKTREQLKSVLLTMEDFNPDYQAAYDKLFELYERIKQGE